MDFQQIGSTTQQMHDISADTAGSASQGGNEPPRPPVRGGGRWVPRFNAAEVIAIAAFIFSVGNAFFAYSQIRGEQHHQSRLELNDVVKRLGELQRSAIDLNNSCLQGSGATPTPQQRIVCSSTALQFQAEQRALVDIGRSLADKLGNDVESSEYRTLALALSSLNDNSGAKDFLDRAIDSASDVQDRVSALQLLANIQFVASPDDGRTTYTRALQLVADGSFSLEIDRGLLEALILRDWSQNEAGLGDCNRAKTAFQGFLKAARQLPLVVREPFLGLAVPDSDAQDEQAGEFARTSCVDARKPAS
jgi:hypothetical protein